jgi:hypothetical protein
MFNFTAPEKKESTIKPGKYTGVINKAELKKTKAGHDTISLWLKLEGNPGFHFVNLNMGHEKTKQISQDTISRILFGALVTPVQALSSLQDICDYVTGLPVSVAVIEKIKNGETVTNTYFNDCAVKLPTKEAVKSAGAASVNW